MGTSHYALSLSVLDDVYTLNTKIDAMDSFNYWYSAKIVQMDILNQRAVRVHYDGYSIKWNEWIKIDTQLYRITTHKTRSMGHGKKEGGIFSIMATKYYRSKKGKQLRECLKNFDVYDHKLLFNAETNRI